MAALGNVEALNRELLLAHFGRKWLFQLLRHKLDSLMMHLHGGSRGSNLVFQVPNAVHFSAPNVTLVVMTRSSRMQNGS